MGRLIGISVATVTSDASVVAGDGRIYWIAASAGATGGAFQINDHASADSGTDLLDITMPASSVQHFLFDPPIKFANGIYIDVPGTNLKVTVGYTV